MLWNNTFRSMKEDNFSSEMHLFTTSLRGNAEKLLMIFQSNTQKKI